MKFQSIDRSNNYIYEISVHAVDLDNILYHNCTGFVVLRFKSFARRFTSETVRYGFVNTVDI